jgi:hypothetical protein
MLSANHVLDTAPYVEYKEMLVNPVTTDSNSLSTAHTYIHTHTYTTIAIAVRLKVTDLLSVDGSSESFEVFGQQFSVDDQSRLSFEKLTCQGFGF